MLNIVVDLDMILYMNAVQSEQEIDWGEGIVTLHADADEIIGKVKAHIEDINKKITFKMKYEGYFNSVLCYSDSVNFRKQLYPLYKANRANKRKPLGYYKALETLKTMYDCVSYPSIEADDVIGIIATENMDNTVVVSLDKDFKTIPCTIYNFRDNTLYEVSEEEANFNFLVQTLTGDTADNYCGCKGIGIKKATDALLKKPTWDTVVSLYEKQGFTEEDAIVQAQLAFILQKDYYNKKRGEVKLWLPQSHLKN